MMIIFSDFSSCSSLGFLSSSLCWLILSFAVLSDWLGLIFITGSWFAVSLLLSGWLLSRWGRSRGSLRLSSIGFSLGFLGLFDVLSLFLGALNFSVSLFLGVSGLLFLVLTCFQV